MDLVVNNREVPATRRDKRIANSGSSSSANLVNPGLSGLAIASISSLGGVIVGANLFVDANGVLSANAPYTHPDTHPASIISQNSLNRFVTDTQITNWNASFGWGNHALAGYAKPLDITTAINNLIASAPGALDTLNELATALGDDPNFATTVNTAIGLRMLSSDFTNASVISKIGYTPYNPASYPVNLNGETLDSVLTRGNSTTRSIVLSNAGKTFTLSVDASGNLVLNSNTGNTAVTSNGDIVAFSGSNPVVSWWDALSGYVDGTTVTFSGGKLHASGGSGMDLNTSSLTNYYLKSVIDNYFSGVTSKTGYNKTNWDFAYGYAHTHANLSTLDAITGTVWTSSNLTPSNYHPLENQRLSTGNSPTFNLISASSLTDGYIIWSAAQINRTGDPVELQYTGMGAVQLFGSTSKPILFSTTGAGTFSGPIIAAKLQSGLSNSTYVNYDVNQVDAYYNGVKSTLYLNYTGGGNIQTGTGIFTFAGVINSTVAIGTSPMTVTSTTLVSNLNADMLDGRHLILNSNISGGNVVGIPAVSVFDGNLYNLNQANAQVFLGLNLISTQSTSGLSSNYLPKWNGSELANSQASDNGTSFTLSNRLVVGSYYYNRFNAPTDGVIIQGTTCIGAEYDYVGGNKLFVSGNLAATGEGNFGLNTLGDQGVRINYVQSSAGYGRIRFYDGTTNSSTIHSFSTSWQNGTFEGYSTGAINITGTYGVTFGLWSSPDVTISTGGRTKIWNNTASSASNNGALVVVGGLGVGGNISVGGNINAVGNFNAGGTIYASTFSDGYITYSAARIDRTGQYVELQYLGTGGVRMFGASGHPISFDSSTGNLTAAGDVIAFSDAKLKTNFRPIQNALALTCMMTGVIFNWNGIDNHETVKDHLGYKAHEMQKILPQVVIEQSNGYLGIAYQKIIPVLSGAIKELNFKVDSEVDRLKYRVSQLENEIQQLKMKN